MRILTVDRDIHFSYVDTHQTDLSYFGLSTAVCYVYANRFLEVDEDEIEQATIFSEHVGMGFAAFLVSYRP